MNQKYLKYTLITALCMVWGVIFFKVLAAFDNPTELGALTHKAQAETNYATIKDSFVLLFDYEDPFLLEDSFEIEPVIVEDTIQQTTSKPIPAVNYEKQVQKEDLNFIQYLGSIYNSESKSRTAIISLRGKEILIKNNETIEGVKIKNLNPEFITIIYNGNKHIIYKQL